jgi:uncharacterized SAM-binding protein YcdF (DUF218 family)
VQYLISLFTTPSGVVYLISAAGLLCLVLRRLRRAALPLLATSAGLVIVFSSGTTATALMSPLEYTQPALDDARNHLQASDIVVLTGWAGDDPNLPLSAKLNDASAYRVLLALELYRERPDCRVIVTGHGTARG